MLSSYGEVCGDPGKLLGRSAESKVRLKMVMVGPNHLSLLALTQAFLCFRPHEQSLDIPGGPAEQYCSLARDLQLQAFLQFVSGLFPPPSSDRQVVGLTRVIFRSQALIQLSHPIGEGALFLRLLIKIAQLMCSEPHPVPGSVPAVFIPDLIYPSTQAFR